MLLHHALAVDDVLDEIFKRLTYHNTSIINVNHQTQLVRRDLLAIALCCKTWKDKGLNLLWNRMSSLAPLLSLLPRMQRIDGKMVLCWVPMFYSHDRYSLLSIGHYWKTRSRRICGI